MMRAIRWGDNDSYFGPFTWCADDWKKWSIVLQSRGGDDDESGQCSLRISVNRFTMVVALPNIVKPHKEKVYPGSSWDAATVARLGRDYYWNVDPRQYGFSCSDGHFNIYYGRTGGSSCDSRTEQRWSCFLPWTQWRHVRHSFHGLQGEHFYTALDAETRAIRKLGDAQFRERLNIVRQWEERCPTYTTAFKDFDGEVLVATTKIEEREWRFGTGWFKWLSLFRKPKIRRSLDIQFSKETGRRKGSWKGGTVGHSIEMLPGEMHRAAFRRYCDQHEMSLISEAGEDDEPPSSPAALRRRPF